MKFQSLFLLTFIGLFSFTLAFSQDTESYRDTIFYQASGTLDMKILIKDYHLLAEESRFQAIMEDFQLRLKEIDQMVPSTAYTIEYRFQKQLDIRDSDKIKSFDISADNRLSENLQNKAYIRDNSGSYEVIIGFNDITELINLDFSKILTAIADSLPEKHRFLRYLEFRPDPQTGNIVLKEDRHTGYFDMLSLQAGVGANVYRGNFLTDFSGEVGLQLNHKGILKNQFYISNNLIFAFDAANTAIINNFTNVGYRRNFSNHKDKPNWLGVELGTLTKRSGDIFQPNTHRLGVNWQVGKHITVSPQLYFNGFFRQVSPGFRIGIGL
ncbi:hypothetical protein SAMN04488057_10663 [Cyclobacterium lianum]|uniref:MetA-pathway of phenol degradation n=1 Tax=Cyclobacterium lianum TaxID=388280 RepID=A0A1M7NTJ9_9BACT|nr:hypothetical protein [Cyclobacterium lianum]SHN07385.1 hypothetical protein SAMN04488057_10663 [Cyclobacterium lianum]